MTPTPALERAISRDSRPEVLLALMEVDTSQVGWADEAVHRAAYSEKNAEFFLREMIKKGIKPGAAHEDQFRVPLLNQDRDGFVSLLIKAGYKPTMESLPLLLVRLKKGDLAQAPKLIPLLPAADRKSALAQCCAAALMGQMPQADQERLNKLWKGEPDMAQITRHLLDGLKSAPEHPGSIASRALALGWFDGNAIRDGGRVDTAKPWLAELQACMEREVLGAQAPQATLTRVRRGL